MHYIRADLLRRYLEGHAPHVDLNVGVHTGDDEEDAGPPGSPRQQPAQPEDDRPLVLLSLQDMMRSVAGETS